MNDLMWGDPIEKIDGYTFRGKFLAYVKKMNGLIRLVAEMDTDAVQHCKCENCLDPNGDGMLHIFSPEQMRRRTYVG